MGDSGYGKHIAAATERKKFAGQQWPKALTINKKSKANKPKSASLKNQIHSLERMRRKAEYTIAFSSYTMPPRTPPSSSSSSSSSS